MRRVPVPLPVTVPALVVCGSLLLTVSCGTGESPGRRTPPAPRGVTVAAGSATSVHVMWNRVSGEPEVAGYEVYRGERKVTDVPGDAHMVDVTRLRPSTTYVFTVRARSTAGDLGPPSAEVRATTPAGGVADRRAPSRPSRLDGRVIGGTAVQLSWGRSADDRDVVSYDILQGDSKIHSVGGEQTAAVVTGLRPGTRYSFTVRARDAADNLSPASRALTLTTGKGDGGPGAGDGAGTAPTAFRAGTRLSDGAYSIDLSWVPPRADGVVTEYEIQLDGRPATTLVWGGTPPRGRATYSFYAGREAGVMHRVRIRAKLPDGTWGAFSAERTVTTGG
ncbi:fibronectin type III domain-containing protein [Streptomyces heilongjiangensis]|uniref:Fibronectin type III domain-containing protein n=1 Tax=Streptomyces heilongjiangensis TaxID=945052 RepID=A0ABW1BHZ9_9ACTN|nr:fibronectin type III domain-containing protein [Streptomyces heilongjiangensis]MDC2952139.1 fibronectin type III domain-containing protein [Streptomyces heilongjiangensis]